MSTEVLREAAALMRERAVAAVASLSDNVPEWHSVRALMGEGKTQGDAEHIASWHPAVALAVADWLNLCAEHHDELPCPAMDHAATVARAYLGEV